MSVTKPMFQLFEPLPPDEYAALKADIAKRGVLVPIEFDEEGNILDGHHRHQICQELGIKDFPQVVRRFSSLEEKEEHVVTLNVRRRHLTNDQKKKWAAWFLRRHPERSDRQIGREVGLDNKTVASVRAELERREEIPHVESRSDSKGRLQPATKPKPTPPPSIFATSDDQAKRAQQALLALGDQAPSKMLDVKHAERMARDVEREQRRLDAAAVAVSVTQHAAVSDIEVKPGQWWQLGKHLLYCGDSADEEFIARAKGSRFAFADPPYNAGKAAWDHGFEWRHDYLAEVADVAAVTPGISAIADFFKVTTMPYRWSMAAWITNGMTRGALGFGNWIYIALFSTAESLHRNAQDHLRVNVDVSTTGETAHESRKPAGLLVELLHVFTEAGDTVVDPFLGSGTTLFAAERTGRRCIGAEINPDYCREIIARYGPEARPL